MPESDSTSQTGLNLFTRRIFTRKAFYEAECARQKIPKNPTKQTQNQTATLNSIFYMAFSRVPQVRPWARDRKLKKRLVLSTQLIHDLRQDCTFPNMMYPRIQPLPCLQRGLWDNTISCRQNAGQCDIISHLATLLLLGDLPLCFKGPFLSRENQ